MKNIKNVEKMRTKAKNFDIRVTKDVYWKLVEMKFNTRCRSIDEVLRKQLEMKPIHRRVKRYSDESVFRNENY